MSENKYPCLKCDGSGYIKTHGPDREYSYGCLSCGGTGIERLVITREEYNTLQSQLAAANEQIGRMRERLESVKGELQIAYDEPDRGKDQWIYSALNIVCEILKEESR